jgi:HD-GYP domain-containing protein (c-di-GMP phosphodiesterase class II)
MSLAQNFEKLLNVGIALSSIHDLEKLLDLILLEARRLTQADAGTLYLVKGDTLVFRVSQCQTLTERLGDEGMRQMYQSFVMPISRESIAGYSALTKEVLNLADVNKIRPESSYRFNSSWDERAGYTTRSMMVVPMLNRNDEAVGVLQLINALRGGRVVPFRKGHAKLASSLASQAAVAIENAELTEDLKQAHLDTIFRLGVAAEYRDKETANHLKRMSRYSAVIARGLGWPEGAVETLLWSSLMHDVGKLGIPDRILQKPGVLEPGERKMMECHTTIGANILQGSRASVMKQSQVVALTHHEKFDGTGYPRGLAGEKIPIEGRVTLLADVFDALSSKRVYKEAFAEEEVLRALDDGRGSFFDPFLVDVFLANLGEIRDIQYRYSGAEENFDGFQGANEME